MYCLGIFTYCTSWTKLTLRLFCHIIWQCYCTTSPLFRHLLLIHSQIIKSFITGKISPDPWLGKIQNFTFIFRGLDFFFFFYAIETLRELLSHIWELQVFYYRSFLYDRVYYHFQWLIQIYFFIFFEQSTRGVMRKFTVQENDCHSVLCIVQLMAKDLILLWKQTQSK